MPMRLPACAFVVLVVCAVLPAFRDAAHATPPVFGTVVNVALVRFRFEPAPGGPARELLLKDIEMRENGARRPVAVFGHYTPDFPFPVEISLLFDCGASAENIGRHDSQVFRDGLLDEFPKVSIAAYRVGGRPEDFGKPTRDPAVLEKAMDRIALLPASGGHLLGAIADAVRDRSVAGSNVFQNL